MTPKQLGLKWGPMEYVYPDTTNGTAIFADQARGGSRGQWGGIYAIHGVSGICGICTYIDPESIFKIPRLLLPWTGPAVSRNQTCMTLRKKNIRNGSIVFL